MMKESNRVISSCAAVVFSALGMTVMFVPSATAQQAATQPKVLSNAVANLPSHFDVSAPLTALIKEASAPQGVRMIHAPLNPKRSASARVGQSPSAVTANAAEALISPFISAAIGLSFEGVGQVGGLTGVPAGINCPTVSHHHYVPPDTNAAVGDTQVVQWINVCYAVFDKGSGALIAGPFAGTNFWKGFGAPCENNNDGDVIIQWDKTNHRWLATQPVFAGPPYYSCIAVSQTADATGSYYRYAFPQQAGFPDYPKWGLKSQVYYQSQNVFNDALTAFLGVNVCAYQADLMRTGSNKASQVCILDNSNGTYFDDSMLPADDDSRGSNGPEVLLGAIDNYLPGDSHVYEYVFTVDFNQPAKSTLAGVDGSMPISVPAFDVSWVTCVPQPSSAASAALFGPVDCLDTLGDRLMYRLAHFVDGGGISHFLVAHSVLNTNAVATRWYEFRAQGVGNTNLSLHQSGQTPDDGEYRWMGSVAMDKMGNIALGYSRSSGAPGDYPSIYYAGRTAGDLLGATESERLIKQGLGSQYNSYGRWGDYSSMALDGADSCTFWYTNEEYPADGRFAFDTWIASLKFPNCP